MERPSIADYVAGAREGVIRGVVCGACGHASVTAAVVCGHCGSKDLQPKEFVGEGTVVSYTILGVPPEIWFDEAPYAFIVVQLSNGPRCTGWMPDVRSPDELKIGDAVQFVKTYKPGMVFKKSA
jgi:uncharacterized OB-fold protein